MFRIKICGITSVDDAMQVADAGGDAIGLNFFAASPRACPMEAARSIVERVPHSLCKVGVFVNATSEEIRRVAAMLTLDLVQLHGDEPPEQLRELRGLPVMRAFRPGADYATVSEYLGRCHALVCMPRMVLIDAHVPGAYGGTGQAVDWEALNANRAHLAGAPLVLAGGLKPSNVAGAISAVRPWGVDVAGGVEQRPGKKSATLVREFIEAAKMAFARANASE